MSQRPLPLRPPQWYRPQRRARTCSIRTRLASIIANGYNVNTVNDYFTKIRNEGSPLALFEEHGGIVCPVNNGFRVAELYAYSALAPTAQAAVEARLGAAGWIPSIVDNGTLYLTR